MATELLLVGSQDVARDCAKLKELGVTHILNVAYGVPNAFTDVSIHTYMVSLVCTYTGMYSILFVSRHSTLQFGGKVIISDRTLIGIYSSYIRFGLVQYTDLS